MNAFDLRPFADGDFDAWYPLWRGYQAFVEPGLRGTGAGRRLIEHVCREAAAMGCSRVHWLTHETNTDAMKLYDRIADKPGFVQYRKAL